MTKKSSTVLNVYKNKAFRIVLIYLLISLLWIYFSDKFVEAIDFPESTKTIISMIKGWAFVIVSSYILYILIKNALKQKDSNEERLSDLELRHQQLFQTSMDGIIYTEPNGNIYAVNDEACRILGSTREEIIFAGRDSIVDNSDPRLIQALNERKEKGYFFGELNFKRKNGEIFPAELTSTIVKSKDGKELAYIIFRDISDKKKIEHETKRWLDAFEHCAHGIAIGDPRTNNIVACNNAFAAISGTTIREIINTPILSKYAPEEHEHVKNSIVYSDKTGKVRYESVMVRNDGTRFPVQMDIVSVKDNEGNVAYRVATMQDITERKNAESEYRKSEFRFKRLVDEAPDAIIVQIGKKFFYVNEKARLLFGFESKEELIGKNVIDYFHPDYRALVESRISNLNDELNSVPNVEEIILNKGGKSIFVEVSAIPYTVGEKNGALVFLRDISDRKLAEAELEKNRELVHLAGEMAKIGGWEFDVVTGEGTWTDETALIHDVDPMDVTNKSIGLSVYNGIHREKIENAINLAVQKGIPYDLELEMTSMKGVHKWVHTKGIPISENGKVVKLRGSFQDITDLKEKEFEIEKHKNHLEELVRERTSELNEINRKLLEEIEKEIQIEFLLRESLIKEKELNEMKGRFISTVSHEFRTPLTAILTSVELLGRYSKNWDAEKFASHIHRITNSIGYLTKLLDDILLINRADLDKLEFHPEKIDLEAKCHEIIKLSEPQIIQNYNLDFTYRCSNKFVYLDSKLITYILNNLISNAIKYSPNGGSIKFDVAKEGNRIVFEITDNGIGIPKEDIPRLFDSFHRASNAQDIKGTGLGLSIVKRAVDIHKGEIFVDSQVGSGTKFTVAIPVSDNVY